MYTFLGSEVGKGWNVSLSPKVSFSLGGNKDILPPPKHTSLMENRAFQFRAEAMSLLVDMNYSSPEVRCAQGGPGEKDSDDEAPDDDIPPALEKNEQIIFKYHHQLLHTHFHRAVDVSFADAYGKCFMRSFCEILVTESKVFHSTN